MGVRIYQVTSLFLKPYHYFITTFTIICQIIIKKNERLLGTVTKMIY